MSAFRTKWNRRDMFLFRVAFSRSCCSRSGRTALRTSRISTARHRPHAWRTVGRASSHFCAPTGSGGAGASVTSEDQKCSRRRVSHEGGPKVFPPACQLRLGPQVFPPARQSLARTKSAPAGASVASRDQKYSRFRSGERGPKAFPSFLNVY